MYVDCMYLYNTYEFGPFYTYATRRSVSVLPKNLDSGQGLINKLVMGIRMYCTYNRVTEVTVRTCYTPKVVLFKKSLRNAEPISVLKNRRVCLKSVGKSIARY